ncbi:G5 domain-containing protein [Virgisporangium aurantiacum]|uniref:G5 domain-containing protein n=1 Tax=Virgisporangium aurantiacum TaxID=175570 RepID=A0A8J3ZHK8_9ACTN|nr:G5 domain-containing protein [Virgisporangium aurantiacum]GIJ64049.1 hypothetical protein Vau01_115650 [Virgisporangium aurantiacum]
MRRLGAGAIVAIALSSVLALCLILSTVVAVVSPANEETAAIRPQPAVAAESATPSSNTEARSPAVGQPPTVETRTVTATESIPFEAKAVDDPSLAAGTTEVRTAGVAGVKTLTYEITLTNGVQTGKKLLAEVITTAPTTEVTAHGTKALSPCDPNYTGACVPIASDVDCAGGTGNGPAYVKGPVKVVGSDIYDLDNDNDDIGCE